MILLICTGKWTHPQDKLHALTRRCVRKSGPRGKQKLTRAGQLCRRWLGSSGQKSKRPWPGTRLIVSSSNASTIRKYCVCGAGCHAPTGRNGWRLRRDPIVPVQRGCARHHPQRQHRWLGPEISAPGCKRLACNSGMPKDSHLSMVYAGRPRPKCCEGSLNKRFWPFTWSSVRCLPLRGLTRSPQSRVSWTAVYRQQVNRKEMF